MLKRLVYVFTAAALLLFLVTAVVTTAENIRTESALAAPDREERGLADPVTVITVTSATDPDDSPSLTCYTDPVGPPGPPTSPCTLRRAIVEAGALDEAARPILISFDVPEDEAHGYLPTLDAWKIEVFATLDTVALGRLEGGEIIIDGSTQPGGRSDGPKIIIAGPGTGSKDGLVVGDIGGDDANEIRGLAFQNFGDHLLVNTSDNIIEDNWFGVNDDGSGVSLRDDNPEDGSGSSGVALAANQSGNVIQNNVFLGFDGVATAVRGEENIFMGNLVGTRPDGTLDKQTDPGLICTQVDWLGGGGVSVSGDGHQIVDNRFAGLRQEIFELSNQPNAISVSGDQVLIQNNQIGVDGGGNSVGVCGRGVYLAGADQPESNQVLSNTIRDTGLSAVSINGALAEGNTILSNVIEKTGEWPQVEGNPKPEDAIQLGPSLPDAHQSFNPAMVTTIADTAVSGTSGLNSPCPGCTVQLFLDDSDLVTETLQLLATVTADNDGDWTAQLPAALGDEEGIRTTSTTNQFNVISGLSAGTTTKLSVLYGPAATGAEPGLYLPLVVKP
jgi:hypothetical protein